MTLSVRVPSLVSSRSVEFNHWKVLFDFEPFPGGHVFMIREELGEDGHPVAKVRKFSGTLKAILNTGFIVGTTDPFYGQPVPNDDIYRLDSEEVEYLQEISDRIDWGQENTIWLEIEEGETPKVRVVGPDPIDIQVEVSMI